jgi:hypothetical protein
MEFIWAWYDWCMRISTQSINRISTQSINRNNDASFQDLAIRKRGSCRSKETVGCFRSGSSPKTAWRDKTIRGLTDSVRWRDFQFIMLYRRSPPRDAPIHVLHGKSKGKSQITILTVSPRPQSHEFQYKMGPVLQICISALKPSCNYQTKHWWVGNCEDLIAEHGGWNFQWMMSAMSLRTCFRGITAWDAAKGQPPSLSNELITEQWDNCMSGAEAFCSPLWWRHSAKCVPGATNYFQKRYSSQDHCLLKCNKMHICRHSCTCGYHPFLDMNWRHDPHIGLPTSESEFLVGFFNHLSAGTGDTLSPVLIATQHKIKPVSQTYNRGIVFVSMYRIGHILSQTAHRFRANLDSEFGPLMRMICSLQRERDAEWRHLWSIQVIKAIVRWKSLFPKSWSSMIERDDLAFSSELKQLAALLAWRSKLTHQFEN